MTDITEFDLEHAGVPVHGHGWDAWLLETRELLKLAGPLILTQLAQMAIGTTDAVMLAQYSKQALAGAVLGNTMFYFCWLLGSGPTSAVSPMIAHILGADPKNKTDVRVVVRMGFWSVVMIGLPLVVFLWFTKPMLILLGQSDQLAEAAAAFVVPLSFGLPFSLAFQVLRNYSTALSKPNATLIVMGFAVVFNVIADYALIFGHFGFPRLGLLGSGIASASSFFFSFTSQFLIAFKKAVYVGAGENVFHTVRLDDLVDLYRRVFGRILSRADSKASPYSRYYIAVSTPIPWKHIMTVIGGVLARLGKLDDGTAHSIPADILPPPASLFLGASQHVCGQRAKDLGWEPRPVVLEDWADAGITSALAKMQN